MCEHACVVTSVSNWWKTTNFPRNTKLFCIFFASFQHRKWNKPEHLSNSRKNLFVCACVGANAYLFVFLCTIGFTHSAWEFEFQPFTVDNDDHRMIDKSKNSNVFGGNFAPAKDACGWGEYGGKSRYSMRVSCQCQRKEQANKSHSMNVWARWVSAQTQHPRANKCRIKLKWWLLAK